MNLRRKMKADARDMLHDRKGAVAMIVLIRILISLLLSSVSPLFIRYSFGDTATTDILMQNTTHIYLQTFVSGGITTLLTLIFIVPLTYGIAAWYYALTFGGEEGLAYIFCGFDGMKRFFRIIGAQIIISVSMFFMAFLIILPAIVTSTAAAMMSYMLMIDDDLFRLLILVGVALYLIGLFYIAVLYQRYMLVPYLLAGDRDLTAWRAVRKSIKAMKGYKVFIVIYYITMIPQLLLCIFIIPIFFIEPKIQSFFAIFARYRIENYGRIMQNNEQRTIR
jgi:hypothetical protein